MKKRFPPLRSFVIGGNSAIDRIMSNVGFDIAKGLGDAEIVIFQGGEDVSPYLYGDDKNPRTNNNEQRDKFEFACYKATKGKFRIGICRGAQFLNVMNGGFLWQHVDGHCNGPHDVVYSYPDDQLSGRHVSRYYQRITSTHHQMIQPKPKVSECWAMASCSRFREGGNTSADGSIVTLQMPDIAHQSDTEICWYPSTRSLCFQPHPEYNSEDTRELFFDCVERAMAF